MTTDLDENERPAGRDEATALIVYGDEALSRLAAAADFAAFLSAAQREMPCALAAASCGALGDWAPVGALRVGAEAVAQGPPAPDLFLEASRRLGLAPWRCIVLAASSDGLRGAALATCPTIALATGPESELDAWADHTALLGEKKGEIDTERFSMLADLTPERLRSIFFALGEPLYADVAVAMPVAQTYTYGVPDRLRAGLRPGSMVRVAVRGREAQGVVVRLSLRARVAPGRIKPIRGVLTPDYAIAPDLLALGRWMSEYYLSGPGETLSAVSFFGLRDLKPRTERRMALADFAFWQAEAQDAAPNEAPRLTARQRDVVRFLLAELNEPIVRAELCRRASCSASVVEGLLKKGILVERTESVERTDAYAEGVRAEPHALGAEQQRAFDAIDSAVLAGRYEAFLLLGITGSGKTEVYLQAIARVLALGRQAIVLVPEISLTPQAVERFRSRFGERVGVYHSHLTAGQKYDLWRRIDAGGTTVLIGARSALFAPFPNLGLIVVDEEHEHSYKQGDPAPRYHARDVAVWRARFARAPVVLGSATPSLESLWNAAEPADGTCGAKYTRLEMPCRVGQARLPEVRLIDMGAHVRDDRRTSLVSAPLEHAIAERLERQEQTILFLNRRGFSNFLLCLACKTAIRCTHCDVVMTWHKTIRQLMCHFCGEMRERPALCPECGTAAPAEMGAGTQRIEEEVVELFPRARVLRIDFDTTRGRYGFLRMWEKIERGEADILLGTQMIAKGLHLDRVTLVGVISADHSLFLPDFRAAERAFAQLTQVAGRAGRAERPGEVLVQTFVPNHYAIQRAVVHDSEGFWRQELHMREMLRFPPYWRLLLARLSGLEPERVEKRAVRLGELLRERLEGNHAYRPLSLLGPVPSPIGKLQDKTRWQMVIRGRQPALMRSLLGEALAVFEKDKGRGGVALTLDMDPLDLL